MTLAHVRARVPSAVRTHSQTEKDCVERQADPIHAFLWLVPQCQPRAPAPSTRGACRAAEALSHPPPFPVPAALADGTWLTSFPPTLDSSSR